MHDRAASLGHGLMSIDKIKTKLGQKRERLLTIGLGGLLSPFQEFSLHFGHNRLVRRGRQQVWNVIDRRLGEDGFDGVVSEQVPHEIQRDDMARGISRQELQIVNDLQGAHRV